MPYNVDCPALIPLKHPQADRHFAYRTNEPSKIWLCDEGNAVSPVNINKELENYSHIR